MYQDCLWSISPSPATLIPWRFMKKTDWMFPAIGTGKPVHSTWAGFEAGEQLPGIFTSRMLRHCGAGIFETEMLSGHPGTIQWIPTCRNTLHCLQLCIQLVAKCALCRKTCQSLIYMDWSSSFALVFCLAGLSNGIAVFVSPQIAFFFMEKSGILHEDRIYFHWFLTLWTTYGTELTFFLGIKLSDFL